MLRDFQASFARALVHGANADEAGSPMLPNDGLDLYREFTRQGVTESLQTIFPTTAALAGTDDFARASEQFWRAHPPGSAWTDAWGAQFPRFVAQMSGLRWERVLPDVARFEWALHAAEIAPDAPSLACAALSGFGAQHVPNIRFQAHPSVQLLRLRLPADAIVDAMLDDEDTTLSSVDLDEGPVNLLVHRAAVGVASERLDPGTAQVLWRLFAGTPLGEVLASAPRRIDVPLLVARTLSAGRFAGASGERPTHIGRTQ